MVFVNENVSDVDKSNILFKKKNPFPPNHNIITPYVWTIDRERDFILVKVGGSHPERPDGFVFLWKGEVGAVEATSSFSKDVCSDSSLAYNVTWRIECIYLPVDFNGDVAGAISNLIEAFKKYGLFAGKVNVRSVDVHSDGCGVSIGGGYVTF